MVEIFHDSDGNLSFINSKIISIIGYGNQGRAQALNLRDSGLNVIIGNIEDKYKKIAMKDGFNVLPIRDALTKADISFILVPDELIR